MFKTKCIKPAKPKLFDAKCTRLACLLGFASLFSPLAMCLVANTEKRNLQRGIKLYFFSP